MRYLLLLIPLLASCASPSKGTVAQPAVAVTDEDRIVRDLCDKRIALLGEESDHGNARTIAFKAALIRRLVEECHYDAFYIETAPYDFLHLQAQLKAGQPVSEAQVAAGIGGMWANQEMAPLIPFLTERLNAGTLVAGAFDDQLNRSTYAQTQMPRELISFLDGPRQAECGPVIERHMTWKYDDAHPFTVETAKRILGCWKDLAAAPLGTPEQLQMVRNLERSFTRQVTMMSRPPKPSGDPWERDDYNSRELSMFMNLEWLLSQSPKPRKAIVWLATLHAAKGLKGLVTNRPHRTTFGSHVQKKYGAQAFVLGFSALSGSYSTGMDTRVKVIPPALADSLEGLAFSGHTGDTRYLDASQLRAFGPRKARPFDYVWIEGPWETVIDGLLIIREEAPPRPL